MCTAVVAVTPSIALVQRLDAPAGDLVHVDVERRLIELDHVDAVGRERARFLVEQAGERHRHLHAVAVVAVGDRCR